MRIYVSGVHSGPNPSSGVGVARSLRLAYPAARLIAVDYSTASSGLHSPDFDDIWLQRPWNEMDVDDYGRRIADLLDGGALWISTLDLEIHWLGGALRRHPNLLVPPTAALHAIAKPAIPGRGSLPVGIPPFVPTTLPDWDLHAFCRRHGWRVWLKGPYHDARRVWRWDVLRASRADLAALWSTEDLFLQAHVTGYEESIAFCAHEGRLLDAVYMSKRDVTHEGKTWAGRVTAVPDEWLVPLRRVVEDLRWTGGAELEMVRDAEGGRWLMDWNPRFPAWIHGTTIAGHNLPGLLVAARTGVAPREATAISPEFTRVVLEVPVRPDYPLAPLGEPATGAFGVSGKHPSGMLKLAARLHRPRPEPGPTAAAKRNGTVAPCTAPIVPSTLLADLAQCDVERVATPCPLLLGGTARAAFERAAELAASASTPGCQVLVAYSIKTNPDDRLLALWQERGLLAEAISQLELQKALAMGFTPDRMVLNGPGKWWPASAAKPGPLRAIFCDSLEDLRYVVGQAKMRSPAQAIGVRLTPVGVSSRFGLSLGSFDVFREVVSLAAALPADCDLGIHFHMASSVVGVEQWWQLYDATLRQCQALEAASRRAVKCLDIGGGWFPDDFNDGFPARLRQGIATARRRLPRLGQVILEPGKALLQPAMALAVRVLEVRRSAPASHEITELVVDGSIAELPQAHAYPHRILAHDRGRGAWRALGRGRGRILGRICMEDDILAMDVDVPHGIAPGETLIICDTGAYDRSMSHVFGRG